ncbi:replicative DNA helicase [Streptomyces canus]|uniref:replicative DNA helicase n=1 Tax=Streptomyces canus TaxID=58343 RepID=UPI0022528B18|nr:replicative DNA helicase [Streptomyces canus]MCX5253568.1 replicative DNA helicase [Streptomyces canus]
MTHDFEAPADDQFDDGPASQPPPFDLDAEKAVLGAMILSSNAVEEVVEVLEPAHFYRPAHETIFRALVDLHNEGAAHDQIALSNRLERDGDLARCGGHTYLVTLVQAVPTVAHAEYYATVIREKAILRKILVAATGMEREALGREHSPDEIIQNAYDTLEGLTTLTDAGDEDLSIGVDIMDTVAEVVDIRENGPKLGLLTGFMDFDALTGGLQPGQFILIAARPAMGKSVLAGDFARYTAIRNDVPTVFFSLEMGRKELEKRFLSAQATYPLHWMKAKGPIDDGKVQKLLEAGKDMQSSPLFIVPDTGITLAKIRSRCRRVQRQHGLGLIVVDYLQLMNGESNGRNDNRQQEVSRISRGLKTLAMDLQVPVIALSQLNRGPEQRQDKKPMLSDLRESGSLEQDADIVILLHREDAYEKDSPRAGEADLIVAKHRNGPTATITVAFQGHYARFVDMAQA